MKIPGYIKLEKCDDAIILLNHLNDLKAMIEPRYHKELKEFYENGCKNSNSELSTFLESNGLLIEKDVAELALNHYYSNIDRKLIITLLPTEECNFRCKYCGENFNKSEISQSLYNSIYKFISNLLITEDINEVVFWFGGEPLLKWIDVNEFTNKVKKICIDKKIKFLSHMTTNGYMLTLEIFNTLYESGVTSYQITLDGIDHDKLKVLNNGGKTYDVILNNIKRISQSSEEKNFKIIVRHNILAGNQDFEWYDSMYQTFNTDKRIYFDIHPVSQFGVEELKLNICKTAEEKETLIDTHLNYARRIGLNLMCDESDEQYICTSAYKHSYTFKPNGDINRCLIPTVISNVNKVGYLLNDDIKINRDLNSYWQKKHPYENCWLCSNITNCKILECPKNKFLQNRNECKYFTRNNFPLNDSNK